MKDTDSKSKVTAKQVLAIVGVVLLVLLYIVTLFAAVLGSGAAGSLFWICIVSTICVPLLLWMFIWIVDRMKVKTDYDPSLQESEDQ